jgi:beta-lactamase class D
MADKKGARSYKGEVIGDSMSITINFKWLLQIICLVAVITFSFWKIEGRIQDLEQGMVLAMEEIELHEEERQIAEEQHIQQLEAQMQEQTVWIEQELGINLNPFSWGKKNRKKK